MFLKQMQKGLSFFVAAAIVVAMGAVINARGVRVAEISSMKGTVTVQRAGTSEWIQGETGMKLYQGDQLKTGGGSKAMIEMDDGTLNKVGPLTAMKIEALSNSPIKGARTDVGVDIGKTWMKVKKLRSAKDQFHVSTPTAVAGVRGTYFASEVEQTSDSLFDVYEGEIDVTAKGGSQSSVLVGTNFRTRVNKGQDPNSPGTIPQSELAESLSEGILQSGPNGSGAYDIQVSVEPEVIQPGGTAVLKVQFLEDGKPYNGSVAFALNLGGSAKFVDNSSESLEVQSNERGFVEVPVTSDRSEQIQVAVDVDFAAQE